MDPLGLVGRFFPSTHTIFRIMHFYHYSREEGKNWRHRRREFLPRYKSIYWRRSKRYLHLKWSGHLQPGHWRLNHDRTLIRFRFCHSKPLMNLQIAYVVTFHDSRIIRVEEIRGRGGEIPGSTFWRLWKSRNVPWGFVPIFLLLGWTTSEDQILVASSAVYSLYHC